MRRAHRNLTRAKSFNQRTSEEKTSKDILKGKNPKTTLLLKTLMKFKNNKSMAAITIRKWPKSKLRSTREKI